MERVAKVCVLAADDGQARGQLGINEAAKKGDDPAGEPGA